MLHIVPQVVSLMPVPVTKHRPEIMVSVALIRWRRFQSSLYLEAVIVADRSYMVQQDCIKLPLTDRDQFELPS